MSSPADNSDDQDELQNLKRQARSNALRLKIAQQNAALAALRSQGYSDKLEGFSGYDPSNYVDLRDYLFDSPPFFGAMPTTRNDRDEGRDFPIFRTEQELAVIRGAARLIAASNPIASGVLTSLTNYVIGNGFHYAAIARDANAADLAKTASAAIEEFLEDNNWSGDLDRELFQRSRIDGEYFLGLWHLGNGRVQARAVEPDQVTEPSNKAGLDEWLGCARQTNWTFGVHSDCDDAQAVHGFYVQWTNRDQDWDYLPGGIEPIIPPQGNGATWMEHAKLNVVRSVKRGLSDFYPIQGNLEIARRVLRNMGEGSAVQAAIAWIQEMAPGTTQAQVNTGTMSRADASYTTPTQAGSRTHWLQQYDPATILKVPNGQRCLPGPLGAQNAASFITAAQALLRTVAVRWNLPENFVTGTAENNNFASSLVAESPFVKFAESQQQFYAQRDRRTLQRVLWFAWLAGRFGAAEWADIKRSIQITVTPPQIEVRDPEKETQVRKTLHDAGILSRKTWAAQEGLDFEQEQKNLKAEADSASLAKPQADTSSQGPAESLVQEEWDPAKHPRGGYDENHGWFSPGWGFGFDPSNRERAEPNSTPMAEAPSAKRTSGDRSAERQHDSVTRIIAAVAAKGIPNTTNASYSPSDFANRLIKEWIDASPLGDRGKKLASNVNDIVNLKQEDVVPFATGIAKGFFFDGLGGSLEAVKDLGSLAVRSALQINPLPAYLYSKWYGEEPLAPEGKAIADGAKRLGETLSAVKNFGGELSSGGTSFLSDLLSGDIERLKRHSQLAQDIAGFAGDMLLDVSIALTDVDAETRGRVLGFVLYQIAEALATEGASTALKSGAVCKAAEGIIESNKLKGLPKVRAALLKSIDLIKTVLNLDICFVAGTPVHTPSGIVPIEALRVGDLVLTRPEREASHANVVRLVTETVVTHPTELLALGVQTSVGSETLRCTLPHPFFVIGRGRFVAAEDLAVGDRLMLADDGTAEIVGIAHEQALPGECFTTYNFAVQECHTYFVGQAAIWVHNASRAFCNELQNLYRKVLHETDKHADAAEAVVDHLAKLLAKPGANLKEIEKELAKSHIPNLPGKELLKRAKERARVAARGTGKYRATLGTATTKSYAATFFKAYPKLEGKVVVHHAIPRRVLTKYPGVISKAELHSLQNLRGIPKRMNAKLHLSKIAKEWNKFFKAHPTATRGQLLEKAKEIDLKFGLRFNPPIKG